jgi:alkaline phosphatase D
MTDAPLISPRRENIVEGRRGSPSSLLAIGFPSGAATSNVATWDDHEVVNDWSTETIDPTRLAAARQAFFEHATPRTEPPGRIWRSLRWGRTVEVFVLDSRSERLPSTRSSAAGGQYLSEEQLGWLVAGLEASRATFKVVVNSVPITEWPLLFLGANDRWPGYAAQRQRVLEASGRVPGTIWLAGDFHFGAVARIGPPGDPFFRQTEILVGPVAHINPALAVIEFTGDPSQFPFLSGERNYARLIFDPTSAPPSLTIEHVTGNGQILNTHLIAL